MTVTRAVAVLRIGVGVAGLLAPRVLARAMLRAERDPRSAVVALRSFAGRDLALGLGALLAARRGPAAVRGWVEAAGLADATDAIALAVDRGRSIRPLVALGVGFGAAAAAASAPLTARGLTAADG